MNSTAAHTPNGPSPVISPTATAAPVATASQKHTVAPSISRSVLNRAASTPRPLGRTCRCATLTAFCTLANT